MKSFKQAIADIQPERIKPQGFTMSSDSGSPPCGDTGGHLTETHLLKQSFTSSWGWLSFTVQAEFLDSILEHLSKHFSAQFVEGKGGQFYGKSYRSEGGLTVETEHLGDGGLRVQIPAGCLESLHPSQLKAFVWKINTWAPKVTRFDATLDHTGPKIPTPASIFHRLRTGQSYLVGFFRHNFDPRDGRHRPGEGFTLYIGKRKGSQSMIRIYDAKGPTRYEAEFHADKARAAWEVFSAAVGGEGVHDSVAEAIASLALGAVSFKIPTGENSSRDPIAPWWERILTTCDAAPIKLQLPILRKNENIERLRTWLEKQVATALAKVQRAYRYQNPSFVQDMIDGAAASLTADQKAWCNQYAPVHVEGPDGKILLTPSV